MAIFLLIIGLILFVGLVVVHEFGHFIMARRNGVEVEEFGIGFPPAIYRKRVKSPKGDYDFTLNALPLGGFVKMKGEHDSDTEPGSFGAASLPAKVKIMVAGVVMNFITAFLLLMVLAWIGMPKLIDNQFTVASDTKVIQQGASTGLITAVGEGSPAERAGLRSGDEIKSINQTNIDSNETLQSVTRNNAGQSVAVEYIREGKDQRTNATLNSRQTVDDSANTNSPVGYLGIGLDSGIPLQRSTWSAPIVAGGLMGQFTGLTFQGLGKAVAGLGSIFAGFVTGNDAARTAGQTAASEQVSGPVGIFVVLRSFSEIGFQFMLFVIAIISLSLAVMNILPIPALDGGRLWFTLLFRAFGRPLSERAEENINAAGFLILIGLIIVISIVDVRRFF